MQALDALRRGELGIRLAVVAPDGSVDPVAEAFNELAARSEAWLGELNRVLRGIGLDGRLDAFAHPHGAKGAWQEVLHNANQMGQALAAQVRDVARVTTAVAEGDLSQKIDVPAQGELFELKRTVNAMVDQLRTITAEIGRVAREVGTEGRLGAQAQVGHAVGAWRNLTDDVNRLADCLTTQVRGITWVTTAVANGDLSKKITADARGDILALKNTVNTMVDRLRTIVQEVTRVARAVGSEGKLGAQALVPEVGGTWKELTDSVNLTASNLTDQVRSISRVVTAVAHGDLSKKMSIVAHGEVATLAETINNMTATLATFAEQVSTVAREVGIEGRLGGQAEVPGAAGTWKDLTDNVNQLAGNLTTQVRAISEVATAVTQGDLTRLVTVEARGEVLELKDTINQMIAKLRDTTRANEEQDWLKTNLASFFGMMQGQRSLEALADQIISRLTPVVEAQHGAFYVIDPSAPEPEARLLSSYAFSRRKRLSNRFRPGEGLVGQCMIERKTILVSELPDDYLEIQSGLGAAPPRHLVVLPILFEERLTGIIELASFQRFTPIRLSFLEQLMLSLGVVMNMIFAAARTEELLNKLRASNVELETRRTELEDKALQLEAKNREIAEAGASLEEKANELARVSEYKSMFLSNMSHEIRTPLNSMLVLAQMLAANKEGTLTPQQVEFAETIHAAGRDLLALIDQILDLSKVEAGRMEVHREEVVVAELVDELEKAFRPAAMQKKLDFIVEVDPACPAAIVTDRQMLKQILRNLLSNAFKFTEKGSVRLRVAPESPEEDRREGPSHLLAFSVSDTGPGIPEEKLEMIFEAFRQAEGTTSRRYGGTGLGLTISREFARVLGGMLTVESQVGKGSTFTAYLPAVLPAPEADEGGAAPGRAAEEGFPTEASEFLRGREVLVVDDDARNLFVTTAALEAEGIAVLPASSGREALDLLEKTPGIELVLLDIMMPEMDGYAVLSRIRANPELKDLPVIAVTARVVEEEEERALEAGFDGFIAKPIEVGQLLRVARRVLKESHG